MRKFVTPSSKTHFPSIISSKGENGFEQTSTTLRILQFNMLADGLSGLRKDLGAFSRVTPLDLDWNRRKQQLLHEVTQYTPDVISMQECDHYYDFFLHELDARGYDSHYAPKPASACLEVHENSDGCVLFWKRNKLRVLSRETLTFALSKADLRTDSETDYAGSDTQMRTQNQVALFVVCRLLDENNGTLLVDSPHIVLATTHLKAAKTATGEKYREREVRQMLTQLERIHKTLTLSSKEPLIIAAGDFNARPTGYSGPKIGTTHASLNSELKIPEFLTTAIQRLKESNEPAAAARINAATLAVVAAANAAKIASGSDSSCPRSNNKPSNDWNDRGADERFKNNSNGLSKNLDANTKLEYDALTYRMMKGHSLGFRSVYNDDICEVDLRGGKLYTTWKARWKKGSESVLQHCIDYIFYTEFSRVVLSQQPPQSSSLSAWIQTEGILDVYDKDEVGPALLPSMRYPSDHLSIAADLRLFWQMRTR
jgi:mRNA deadenylase 3'-5' endonuclease subunit Ccr4